MIDSLVCLDTSAYSTLFLPHAAAYAASSFSPSRPHSFILSTDHDRVRCPLLRFARSSALAQQVLLLLLPPQSSRSSSAGRGGVVAVSRIVLALNSLEGERETEREGEDGTGTQKERERRRRRRGMNIPAPATDENKSNATDLRLRLRVPDGTDVGPLAFSPSTRISEVKTAALAALHSLGRAPPPPSSVKQLVIIHAGKVAEDNIMLSGMLRFPSSSVSPHADILRARSDHLTTLSRRHHHRDEMSAEAMCVCVHTVHIGGLICAIKHIYVRK